MNINPGERKEMMRLNQQRGQEAKVLETVLEAEKDHVCVDLQYNDSWRLIEPSGLKTTRAGNTLIAATKHETGEKRTYRLDRVQAARLSKVATSQLIPGPAGAALTALLAQD